MVFFLSSCEAHDGLCISELSFLPVLAKVCRNWSADDFHIRNRALRLDGVVRQRIMRINAVPHLNVCIIVRKTFLVSWVRTIICSFNHVRPKCCTNSYTRDPTHYARILIVLIRPWPSCHENLFHVIVSTYVIVHNDLDISHDFLLPACRLCFHYTEQLTLCFNKSDLTICFIVN